MILTLNFNVTFLNQMLLLITIDFSNHLTNENINNKNMLTATRDKLSILRNNNNNKKNNNREYQSRQLQPQSYYNAYQNNQQQQNRL